MALIKFLSLFVVSPAVPPDALRYMVRGDFSLMVAKKEKSEIGSVLTKKYFNNYSYFYYY